MSSSSRLTSPSLSFDSSRVPETGLTTVEDVTVDGIPKTLPVDERQAEASSSTASPRSGVEEEEQREQHTPISQAQSDVYTPTTYPNLTLFAPSELAVGLELESDASSDSLSGGTSSSSTSSAVSGGGGSGSTVRIRATAGAARATTLGDETAASSTDSPSSDVVFALPRIRFPEDDTLRTFMFEPSIAPTARTQRTHHRRRSSASSSRRVVHKYHERGISRDFFLIVALCAGFACMVILIGRPAMMSFLGRVRVDVFDEE